MSADTERQLPRYRSHKLVRALKIGTIAFDGKGGASITPADDGYAPFTVDAAYINKHTPQAGGYYVVYDDGYKSFSPAKAFEDGYTAEHPPASPQPNKPGYYRSKPTEITAWKWMGDPKMPGVCTCGEKTKPHLHTMHDGQAVELEVGDWIVPEPMPDRYYPIKSEVFERKYEPAGGGGAFDWAALQRLRKASP